MKAFEKNYNMYVIPGTKNCFKIEICQENKKPMFKCCFKVVVKNKYQNNIEVKTKKIYNKDEAFNFVLEMHNLYLSKQESEETSCN